MRQPTLPEWVKVDRSVARSVNLERDADNKNILHRFQVTNTACETLRRLADAMEGESVNAWSLTGPYGTGKSAFCNFLIALTCGDRDRRALCHGKLRAADTELAARLKPFVIPDGGQTPGIGVRAVSRYESLNSTLARGLASAMDNAPDRRRGVWKQLRERALRLAREDWPATKDVVEVFGALSEVSGRRVFLVVDEFGKNLEFQAHHPDRGDIFALQALSETNPVFLWVCLHQSFSSYSGSLSRVQREEWQKIQGRFEDRPYIEPPTRSFALIRDVLSVEPPDSVRGAVEQWALAMQEAVSGLTMAGFPHLDLEKIKRLYPFHPLSVYFIGELTRRFAQNDRTIFTFLASGERHAFSSWLSRMEEDNKDRLPTLGLDALYDYFCEAGPTRHNGRSENQRWLEIQTMIESHNGMPPASTRLLKTVGVLNLLGSLPGVLASEEMVHAAMASSYYRRTRETSEILRGLVGEKTLLYREYAGEYRLWEGSDFDLDQEVLQARGRVAVRDVAETLEEIAPRPNLVAARHSLQTGNLREFSVRWCTEGDLPSLMERTRTGENRLDGTVWLMLGRRKILDPLLETAGKGSPVIVAYSPCLEQVWQLMLEAAATREACSAPQLERDGVARREARHRADQAAQTLEAFLNDAFAPGRGSAVWFADGAAREVGSQRELSALASDLCDLVYRDCPRINNEMLNADRLSSMAAAARNKVAEALANNYRYEDLGLKGFGPEVAVYRTVIKETGLHRPDGEGAWKLASPDPEQEPGLAAVWNLFDRLLAGADQAGEAVPVGRVLAELKQPPFGLREGPAPLLLAHYLLVHADEVAVYEDEVFKPFFGDAEITLLMRRPELFSLRSYRPSGIRSEVIRTYYQVVNTELDLAGEVRNRTMLAVVVPLTEFINSLPPYTRATRAISANAQRLRNAIANARDPQQLLFRDIPEALGFRAIESVNGLPYSSSESARLRKELWNAVSELREAFGIFVKKIRRSFIREMAEVTMEDKSAGALRYHLRQNISPLLEVCLENELKPFMSALASENGSDDEWLLRVAGVIMKKTVETWLDADIGPFILRLRELQERIQRLKQLKRLADRHGPMDENTRFIGVTGPNGRLRETSVRLSARLTPRAAHLLKEIEMADRETRLSLLAGLLEAMEQKGDIK